MNNKIAFERLDFEYPCAWGYSLIAVQESHIYLAIHQTFGQHPVTVGQLRKSSGGNWCAVNVDTTVNGESQRITFLETLRKCVGIRYVL
ncbi:MAG: DUF493 domain-containing protein [Phycisphaerales bacterium]|nr:DUF493 domain-containing protein [Phycisphaerales bacterium]